MAILWRRFIPLLLTALVAAGVVSSGPDGGNHHPKTRADRAWSWGLMTGGALVLGWTAGGVRRLWQRRVAAPSAAARETAGPAGGLFRGAPAPATPPKLTPTAR